MSVFNISMSMKKPSETFEENSSWLSSPETFSPSHSDSGQINGNRLAEAYEDDLAKNQWIVFALVAICLLLIAAGVSLFGELALRLAEPTATPSLASELLPYRGPSSPTATVMPSPSPTIPTPTLEPLVLKVLPSTANLRSAPSLNAKVVGSIKKASMVTPLAQSVDGRWFLIVSPENGVTGWVANELFERISGDFTQLPISGPVSQ